MAGFLLRTGSRPSACVRNRSRRCRSRLGGRGGLARHEGNGVGRGFPCAQDRLSRSAQRYPQRQPRRLGGVGDRWALLTIRELGFGVTRFNDIQTHTGAPRASLAARLRELEDAGLVERRQYSSHPPRDEYLLTPAGQELAPVITELRAWGERHARPQRDSQAAV